MPDTITLQTIAKNLSLTKTTVSVALRGKPGVSELLRATIVAEAKRLGYKPNPVAAELMSLVRDQRKAKSRETIAFVNTFQDPGLIKQTVGLRRLLEGAAEQAAQYGYRVEEFCMVGRDMNATRLDHMLKARGIRGLLIGPRWLEEPEVALDWPQYSCVVMGEASFKAKIHRVASHHAQVMKLALARMTALGYRRIGIELTSNYEAAREFEFLAGIGPAEYALGQQAHFFTRLRPLNRTAPNTVSPLAPDDRTPAPTAYTKLAESPELESWINEQRLDALITHEIYDPKELLSIKTEVGHPIGYAVLDADPASDIAGVDQHPTHTGKTAMELLRALLHAGERGQVAHPRIVLLEGSWVDGQTAPGRPTSIEGDATKATTVR